MALPSNYYFFFKSEWEKHHLDPSQSYTLMQTTKWASDAWRRLSKGEKDEYKHRFYQSIGYKEVPNLTRGGKPRYALPYPPSSKKQKSRTAGCDVGEIVGTNPIFASSTQAHFTLQFTPAPTSTWPSSVPRSSFEACNAGEIVGANPMFTSSTQSHFILQFNPAPASTEPSSALSSSLEAYFPLHSDPLSTSAEPFLHESGSYEEGSVEQVCFFNLFQYT
jgi:hypothetical protein